MDDSTPKYFTLSAGADKSMMMSGLDSGSSSKKQRIGQKASNSCISTWFLEGQASHEVDSGPAVTNVKKTVILKVSQHSQPLAATNLHDCAPSPPLPLVQAALHAQVGEASSRADLARALESHLCKLLSGASLEEKKKIVFIMQGIRAMQAGECDVEVEEAFR